MIAKNIMKQIKALDHEICLQKRGGKWCKGNHIRVNAKRLQNAIWNAYGGDLNYDSILTDEHALSDALDALHFHEDYWKNSSESEMENYIRQYWETS